MDRKKLRNKDLIKSNTTGRYFLVYGFTGLHIICRDLVRNKIVHIAHDNVSLIGRNAEVKE